MLHVPRSSYRVHQGNLIKDIFSAATILEKHARATDMIYDICIIPHGGLVEKLAEKAQEAVCDRFAMQCTSRDQIFKAPHTTACRSSIRATKRDIDHGVRNHLSDLRFQVHANPPAGIWLFVKEKEKINRNRHRNRWLVVCAAQRSTEVPDGNFRLFLLNRTRSLSIVRFRVG